MFLPYPPPAPDQPRITAVEYRLCESRDLPCHVEFANDQLEAMVKLVSSTSSGLSRPGDIHLRNPGVPGNIRLS